MLCRECSPAYNEYLVIDKHWLLPKPEPIGAKPVRVMNVNTRVRQIENRKVVRFRLRDKLSVG